MGASRAAISASGSWQSRAADSGAMLMVMDLVNHFASERD